MPKIENTVNKPGLIAGGKVFTQPVVKADDAVKLPPQAQSEPAPEQPVVEDATVSRPAYKDKNADTTPLNEMIVMNYKSSKKKDTARLRAMHEVHIKTRPDTAPEQRLQANVPDAKVYPNTQSAAELERLLTQGSLGTAAALANW